MCVPLVGAQNGANESCRGKRQLFCGAKRIVPNANANESQLENPNDLY